MDARTLGRWLLIAALAWLTWSVVRTPLNTPVADSFLHLPNLVFHEAGHILFMPFGRFMSVLGGSLTQLLIPIVCAVAFARQQADWFGAAVCTWWAGENLVDLAPYIADARALQLVLLGGRTGAEVEGHDWEYLLTAMGLMHRDVLIGQSARFLGALVMIAAIVWAIALTMTASRRPPPAL
jgi:hypothetical protein